MTASTSSRSSSRDAATVTSWNLASRITGFVRVLVIGGALGATRLGDTYQASNQVSNILFEFLAAGTLSAVLVPGLVARLTRAERESAREFASVLLGRALLALTPILVVGMVFARPVMRLLVSANDSSSHDAQVRLGAFLLLFVLPQLALYAWGAVVTAMLHADGRFAAAAFAPIANNVVVTAALGLFWLHGTTGLHLGLDDRVLLGAGALGGVVCMTVVPAVAAARAGLSLTPRLRAAAHVVLPLRDIAWASLVVVPPQLFLLASLVVAGRVAGGVAAIQIAFTVFLLPHALLGQPVATVLYPRMAASWAVDDAESAREHAARGLTTSMLLTAPAAALLAALAPWIMRGISVGALDRGGGPAVVAAALAGYAVGLVAYSWSLLVTRISYAAGDVRTPGLAALVGGVAGVIVLATLAEGSATQTVRWIGFAHSTMAVVATLGVLVTLLRSGAVHAAPRRWIVPLVAAAAAGLCARGVANGLGDGGTRVAVFTIVGLSALGGLVVYGALLFAGGVRVRREDLLG